jgi:hypothetical protein
MDTLPPLTEIAVIDCLGAGSNTALMMVLFEFGHRNIHARANEFGKVNSW